VRSDSANGNSSRDPFVLRELGASVASAAINGPDGQG
jgi:hypothetical protein